MQSSMLKAIVEDFGNGGTIDGDLVVSGDLTVSGGGSLSFDEIIEGTQVIDVNSTEALLVRKNGDGGDVFKVDSTNATIYIQDGIGTLPSLFGGHQLVLQNNNDSGDQSRLALISGATGYSVLDFGDASDVDAGGIAYQNHASDDLMTLRVNATDFVYIKDSGVGIGGSPSSLLHLQGNNGNASHTLLKIHNNDVTSNTETGQTADIEFSFQGTTDGGSNFVTKNAGAIRAGKESDYFTSSADNMDSFLAFYTSQDNTNTLAMHIDASQNVGINEVSPDKKLHITSSTSTDGIMVEQSGVGSALISFKADNANRGFIGVDDSNGGAILSSTSGSDYIMCLRSEQEMHFGTNGNNVALQLDTSQNATFAGSVTSGNKYVIDGNTASNQKFQFHDDNVGLQRAGGSDRTANGNSLYVSAYEDIVFTASGTVMGSQTERMRIDSNSRISLSNNDSGGSGNTIFGKNCADGFDDGEEFNVVIGEQAAESQSHDSTDGNVFIGYQACTGGTGSRSESIAIGYRAWGNGGSSNNIGGAENVFIGSESGGGTWATGASDGNTAVGWNTMKGAMNGAGLNTALGKNALLALTEGDNNVAVGASALLSLNTGTNNVAIGNLSGDAMTASSNCVLVGKNTGGAINSADADGTVAVGHSSLKALTSGKKNLAVGHQAQLETTIGDSNIAIGYNAMFGDAGLQNDLNIAIGSENAAGSVLAAMGGQWTSNRCEQNIAIGTGSLAGAMNDSHDNVAVGYKSLNAVTTADDNVAIGSGAGEVTTSGGANTIVGYQALNGDTDGDGADNTALGHKALHDAISPSKNVAIGDSAMRVMNGTANGIANCVAIGANAFYGDATNTTTGTNGTVAVGKDSLKALTTGAGNTAVGYQSGTSITTGVSNTLLGYQAGDGMTAGEDNVAVGHSSLGGASTSSENKRNVAVGVGSMGGTNAGASENVAIGYAALDANLTADADGNVAIGYYAGSAITEGEGNTIVGRNAADALTTGDKNIAIGRLALSSSQVSSNNVAIGYAAMNNTNDADSNGTVAIGYAALNNVTSGAGNVGVGYEVLKQVTTGKHNTSVGYQSMYNAMNVGDSNTAMGYQSLYSLDPDTDDHGSNTAVGKQSGYDVSTGTGNVLVGANAGNSGSNDLTTGDNNTYIGNEAAGSSASNSNSTVIGATAIGSGSNTVTLGNSSVTDVLMAQDGEATIHCAGVKFPPTQQADANANTLDDYEEGTGSPTVSLTGSGSVTLGTSAGNAWTKVGNIVHFQFEFSITGVSSPVGALTVQLPFTSAGTYYSAGSLRVHSETFDGSPFVAINPNSTVAQLKCSKTGSSTTDITPTAGTRYFFGQITYRSA